MAEAVLVDRAAAEAEELAESISNAHVSAIARALLVSDEGEWRLAVISPDVESIGRLGVARQIHSAAVAGGLGGDDISRLVVLGAADPDSTALLMEEVGSRRGVRIEEMPDFRGYVLWRSPSARRVVVDSVRSQLESSLVGAGYTIEFDVQLPIGWRADVRVTDSSGAYLIEIASAGPKSWKSRLRDAAGVANLAAMPVVLVLVSSVRVPSDITRRYGAVPVQAVDWQHAGPNGVLSALQVISS